MTTKIRRRRLRLSLIGLPLAVAACGTTVPAGETAGGHAASGVRDAAELGASDASALLSDAAAPAPGSATALSTDAEAAASTALSADGTTSTSRRRGADATAGALRAGTYYFDSDSTNALISSVGANSAMGDMRAQQRAVADWINRNGGLAGRRLELTQHQIDIQADPSTEAQALCEAWTDRGVVAGVGSLPTANPVLVSCLAKRKTLAIGGSSSNVGTSEDFARWAPYYYAPASVELVSAGRIYGRGLLDRGFFGAGARVGVLYVETPEHQAALRQGLLPALSAEGIEPTDTAGVAYDGSFADYSNLVSQAQSATLRFRSRGVTHVLFVDTGGALAFWFTQQAQSQGYNPRYGLSTLSAPAFLEANVDRRQLRDAVAVGWRPADDVGYQRGLPSNPARELCQRIMKQAGLEPRSAFDLQLQLTTCSGLMLLKAGVDRAGTTDPVRFQSAVAGLGTTNVPSASGFVDRYAAGKPWGGSGYATSVFVEQCGCFRYDSTSRRL